MNVLTKLKGHPRVGEGTAYAILFSMGFCHLLNDMIQSVILWGNMPTAIRSLIHWLWAWDLRWWGC